MSSARTGDARGFSLLELLVVLVVLAIMTAVLVPMATERVRLAKVRTQVNQFTLDLRAARWTAVAERQPVNLAVSVDPGNAYEYTDVHGRLRRIEMPDGVTIVSSTDPIQFLANGSVNGGSTTVIEAPITDSTKSKWTITTNALGVPTAIQQQVGL